MEKSIDISGIDKAVLLAAVFNHAGQVNLGFLDASGGHAMSIPDARNIVQARMAMNAVVKGEPIWRSRFDYLRGRLLKVDLGGESFNQSDIYLYDQAHGKGRLEQAVAFARKHKPD